MVCPTYCDMSENTLKINHGRKVSMRMRSKRAADDSSEAKRRLNLAKIKTQGSGARVYTARARARAPVCVSQ